MKTIKRPDLAAKGRRLQQIAKKALEARGYRVEVAQNVVRWVPGKPHALGPTVLHPISTHHDFFGLWDLLFCGYGTTGRESLRPGEREDVRLGLAQVTTVENLSHRRKKILADGFPLTEHCWILAYVGGRGSHFRLYRPPFETWEDMIR